MPIPRRVRQLLWLLVPGALGAGTFFAVLALRPGRAPQPSTNASQLSASKGGGARMPRAVSLVQSRDPSAVIDAYAAWAGDSSALAARRFLLASLFQEENLPKKLSSVLAAIEADSTPPERDPLWSELAESLSDLWQGETATRAMDLVVAEGRPRARRALISSFAHLVNSERLSRLSAEQRQTLTETLIDAAPKLPSTQRPEVDRALRKLGGNDLADIVAGKGLTGDDGHELESERSYRKSLEETKRAFAQEDKQSGDPE